MTEKIVDWKIEDAYAKLKEVLLKKGCKIVTDETSMSISAVQGSLWGITPRTAKKQVIYHLLPHNSGTRITASSLLASDWKNLTIVGSVLAVFVATMCGWIAIDLETFAATQKPSSWTWIATVDGYANLQVAQMLANLCRGLAVFLAVVIVLEVVIALYAHFRINAFAEETLSLLS
ncbi:hypothetical protein G4O51_02050 [Candidatus Bathyarchaeota archaeon A05DMB-2]|nr:hypothetical protein [Candidatus Bathyarchaeota archaeon A05DMB-2]